jgi:uncharacterized protein
MEIKKDAKLIRIFIGESDKVNHIPVYEKIVSEARKFGMAGATVYQGIMGFGRNSRLKSAKILRLSEDMPIVIEMVDEAEKIESFLSILDEIITSANCGGLITLEKAEVLKYVHSR